MGQDATRQIRQVFLKMTKLTVEIPKAVKTQAEAQAAAAGYTSLDEYICSLIQNDLFQPVDTETERELVRGLDSGPSLSLTPGLIEEIRRKAREG